MKVMPLTAYSVDLNAGSKKTPNGEGRISHMSKYERKGQE